MGSPEHIDNTGLTDLVRQPELLELTVTKYKNLERVVIPWTDRLVVYGQNATGKSNLFEALGLLFGDSQTTWAIASRTTDIHQISAVVRSDDRDVPRTGPLSGSSDDIPKENLKFLIGALNPGLTERLGIAVTGMGWKQDWIESGHDKDLVDLIVDWSDDPMIRYRLEAVEGIKTAAAIQQERPTYDDPNRYENPIERSYARTLVVPRPADVGWIKKLAETLPSGFAPLVRALDDVPEGDFLDILELQPTAEAPIDVTYIPGSRSTHDAIADLDWAVETAADKGAEIIEELGQLLPHLNDPETGKVGSRDYFFAYKYAIDQAARWVKQITDTFIEVGDYPKDTWISFGQRTGSHLSSGAEPLSSGERKWLDVGLSLGTQQVTELNRQLDELIYLIINTDSSKIEAFADTNAESLASLEILELGYLELGDVLRLTAMFKTAPIVPRPARNSTQSEHFIYWPKGSILLIDEPEQHLHPSAQQHAARMLSEEAEYRQVAIATHSHHFLGRDDWQHLFLFRPPLEGVIHKSFRPEELVLDNDIVAMMGITKGELLSFTRYWLFVEGKVDELVLKSFYGEELNRAGVVLQDIEGIGNAVGLMDLSLVGKLADIEFGVLADNTRASHLKSGWDGARSHEEKILFDLDRDLQNIGRSGLEPFTLYRPDIVCYLPNECVQRRFPGKGVPSWHELQERCYDRVAPGACIKREFEKHTGELVSVKTVKQLIDICKSNGLNPHEDLDAVVQDILERAHRR